MSGLTLVHQMFRGSEKHQHVHRAHELFIPLSGEIRFKLGVTELKLGPGKMLFLPAGVEHSFSSSREASGERLILIFNEPDFVQFQKIEKFVILPISQLLKELCFYLFSQKNMERSKIFVEVLSVHLSEMLEESKAASRITEQLSAKSRDPRIQQALKVFEHRFHEDISISLLAKKAGMSQRTLNRLFLLELGATPKQVQTQFRIQEAQRLLKKPKTFVTDVAFEVGYSSLSQFIDAYRKVTGHLPSQEREF